MNAATDPHETALAQHLRATGWHAAVDRSGVWRRGTDELVVGTAGGNVAGQHHIRTEMVARCSCGAVLASGVEHEPRTPAVPAPRKGGQVTAARLRFTIAAHRALGLPPIYTDADLA